MNIKRTYPDPPSVGEFLASLRAEPHIWRHVRDNNGTVEAELVQDASRWRWSPRYGFQPIRTREP